MNAMTANPMDPAALTGNNADTTTTTWSFGPFIAKDFWSLKFTFFELAVVTSLFAASLDPGTIIFLGILPYSSICVIKLKEIFHRLNRLSHEI